MRGNPGVLAGICPNQTCQKKLYFPEHEASVECTGCGQRHTQNVLKNLERTSGVTEWLGAVENLLQQIRKEATKKSVGDHETLKVNGLSNYLCTILSPLLTSYGMDRTTGRAKLLTDMGKSPVFDCAQLGERAFLIEPQHLAISGYGRDRSGSSLYLKDTLNQIKLDNENEERLIPIHADGDGHCLVHAVSRALVGWELFWHPLRVNLKQHFIENLDKYKMQFQDFVDDSEWDLIIQECDPDFVPSGAEPTGLRNIHIFGLANVVKRPIILLDSVEGIQSPGDYSAIFLPYFSPPSECMNKEGVLHKPLCIAWSSLGRNHFIPLVGVKGRKCPVLSRHMIQRAWGVSDIEIDKYVAYDDQGRCQIGGEKVLQSGYFQRLVAAMSDVFFQQHGVSPSLIADVYQHIFKANGLMFGMNLNLLLDKTKTCVEEKRLFVCLSCWSLALAQATREDWLSPGGELYDLAVSCHGKLKDGQNYSFPLHDVVAKYCASHNILVAELRPSSCSYCSGTKFRLVRADYSIEYMNGDQTQTKSSKSESGFKQYWNGKEYDSNPKPLLVLMEWGGRSIKRVVHWFQDEEDPSLNSNVYEIAEGLVEEYFPGEFGSERLVQKVVDQILRQTKKPEVDKSPPVGANAAGGSMEDEDDPASWSPHRASKAILSGLQRQSVHKEELNKNAAERQVKQRIESNAPKQQRKLSDQLASERKHPSLPSEPGSRKTPERRSSPSPSSTPVRSAAATTAAPSATSSSSSSAATAGGSSTSTAASTSKRIRLAMSDGRNVTLDLPSECKFLELQRLIFEAIKVSPSNQRIRHGFPPRELKPPATPAEDYQVPIQSGDKIMLDIVAPVAEQSQSPSHSATSPSPTIDRSKIHGLPARRDDVSWTSFAEGGMDEVSDRVLQGLMDPFLASGGDSLDHSLSALALTAALDNKDLWTYCQMRPHLFSVNGLFYKQVERDVGLEHAKHCHLPRFPHKVFVYNQYDDRLELCLEPYGHFPIELNVEKNAGSMLPSSKCGNKSTHKPFSGQGHMLRPSTSQEERMPTDVPMSPKRHEARRMNTMCDPAVHQESIEEEDEEGEMQESKEEEDENMSRLQSHCLSPSQLSRHLPLGNWGPAGKHSLNPAPEPRLVRKGPGYSELSPIPENYSNEKTEMLQQLVSRIERACESMGQEAQAIGDGMDTLSAAHGVTASQIGQAGFRTRPDISPASLGEGSVPTICPSQRAVSSGQNNMRDTSSFMKTTPSESIPHSSVNMGGDSCQVSVDGSLSSTSPLITPHVSAHSSDIEAMKNANPNAMRTSSMVSAQISPGSDQMSGLTIQTLSPTDQREKAAQANSSMVAALAEQVASDIAAMDTDLGVPAQSEPAGTLEPKPGQTAKESHESMETESQSRKLEVESQSGCSTMMETDSAKGGQTPMEEEDANKMSGAATEMDDLFIKEPSPEVEQRTCSADDTPTSEKMESS